jgi:hypothetical protein
MITLIVITGFPICHSFPDNPITAWIPYKRVFSITSYFHDGNMMIGFLHSPLSQNEKEKLFRGRVL